MLDEFDADKIEPDKLRKMMGPGGADHTLRSAINMVWMTLPPEGKSLAELEKEVRRLVDRAFENMWEDEKRERGPS